MKAKTNKQLCIGCGICIDECKTAAIFFSDDTVIVVEEDCTGCGDCVKLCVMDALSLE